MQPRAFLDNIQAQIIEQLQKAKTHIQVAVAWLTDTEVIKVLHQKTSEGVKVEIILNNDDINKMRAFELGEMEKVGAKIYRYTNDQDGIMHHKFCIIDSQKLLIGSYNWTYNASTKNNESVMFFEGVNNDAINSFIETFKAMKEQMGEVTTTSLGFHTNTLRLKTEMLFLETEIAQLETEKADLESAIIEFEVLLKKAVGHLIIEKLGLEKKIAQLKAFLTRKAEDVKVQEKKEQVFKQYEKTWHEAKQKEVKSLDEQRRQHIKKMYRECMQMVHPDRFIDDPEKYEEANKISAILSEAYKEKDFEIIEQIWQDLQNGIAFHSDWVSDDTEKLKKIIERLKTKRHNLTSLIKILKGHIVWTVKEEHENYDSYFKNVEQAVKANINILKSEVKQFK